MPTETDGPKNFPLSEAINFARLEIAQGTSSDDSIIGKLVQHGWKQNDASRIVKRLRLASNAAQASPEKVLAGAYARHMTSGAILLVIGSVIAVITNGNILSVGAVFVGFIWGIHGLIGWVRNKQ